MEMVMVTITTEITMDKEMAIKTMVIIMEMVMETETLDGRMVI